MEYIVFRNPYKHWHFDVNNPNRQCGYFVSYKDKISDKFSDNWYDAARYKRLGSALNRLGIYGLESTSIEAFIKANINDNISKRLNRNTYIGKILNESYEKEAIEIILESKGRIEGVENNKLIEIPVSEMVQLIIDRIEENNKKIKNKYSKLDFSEDYIDKAEEDLDFWENWANS